VNYYFIASARILSKALQSSGRISDCISERSRQPEFNDASKVSRFTDFAILWEIDEAQFGFHGIRILISLAALIFLRQDSR